MPKVFYRGRDTGSIFIRVHGHGIFVVVEGHGIFVGQEGVVFSPQEVRRGNGIELLEHWPLRDDARADAGMREIWKDWFAFYEGHFRGKGLSISMADQMAFYEIAQPIMRNLASPLDGCEGIIAERDEARQIVREIAWMALRYADGRNTYAPSQVNMAVKKGYDAGWLVPQTTGDRATGFAWDPLEDPMESGPVTIGVDMASEHVFSSTTVSVGDRIFHSAENQMPAMYSETDDEMGPAKFYVGQPVEKFTGDYKAKGEIRGFFLLHDKGPFRYIVRHAAEGGGFFCHIYGAKNLRPVEQVV